MKAGDCINNHELWMGAPLEVNTPRHASCLQQLSHYSNVVGWIRGPRDGPFQRFVRYEQTSRCLGTFVSSQRRFALCIDTIYGFRTLRFLYDRVARKNDRFEFKRARTPSSVVLHPQTHTCFETGFDTCFCLSRGLPLETDSRGRVLQHSRGQTDRQKKAPPK